MALKDNLKTLKLNESSISMILGIIVIVVVGILVVNYFRGLDSGSTPPEAETTEVIDGTTITRDGKTFHIVQAGENLWVIAERYYDSGYNFVDLIEANNLESEAAIEEGQEIEIPDVVPKLATVLVGAKLLADELEERKAEEASEEMDEDADSDATDEDSDELAALDEDSDGEEVEEVAGVDTQEEEVMEDEPQIEPTAEPELIAQEEAISGATYTVVKGDHLWGIAVRAYGDGFRWVDIASDNELLNPNLIHPGNLLSLPQ